MTRVCDDSSTPPPETIDERARSAVGGRVQPSQSCMAGLTRSSAQGSVRGQTVLVDGPAPSTVGMAPTFQGSRRTALRVTRDPRIWLPAPSARRAVGALWGSAPAIGSAPTMTARSRSSSTRSRRCSTREHPYVAARAGAQGEPRVALSTAWRGPVRTHRADRRTLLADLGSQPTVTSGPSLRIRSTGTSCSSPFGAARTCRAPRIRPTTRWPASILQ